LLGDDDALFLAGLKRFGLGYPDSRAAAGTVTI
jgi:hypothetical protein